MSGTPDWRARKRDQTHQRIYETGMRLFAERGYDRVSVGDIAREAKVSVPTFYAHYENKEHIVMQMPSQQPLILTLMSDSTLSTVMVLFFIPACLMSLVSCFASFLYAA